SAALALEEKVFVKPGAVDAGNSAFTASPDSIVAGSGQTSELQLTAKDAKGNLVPGIVGDLEFEVIDSMGGAAGTDVTIKDLQETTPGVYTAKLTGTKVENWSVTPIYKKTHLGLLTKTVKLTATAPAPDKSTFTVSATSGLPYLKITLTLEAKDASGNPLTGLASNLQFVVKHDSLGRPLDPGDVNISETQETATPGTYTAKFWSFIVDDHTIVPLFNGADIGTLSQTVAIKYLYPSTAKVHVKYDDFNPAWTNTLIKSAKFHFRVNEREASRDEYDATIVTPVSWLSEIPSIPLGFQANDVPLTTESVQIKFSAKKGNNTFIHTMTPTFLKPSKDKLSFADATSSCESQGGSLADGIVREAWRDWKSIGYENDLHWRTSDISPSLFDPVTGNTETSGVDPKAKHYYVCMSL
ncbi:invasin domain 3-containing protein, partial [Pseudomonas sp. HMSC08G10]|uniref:invasin domain 3-containing protein n=1 Tax=Pseudomonas sp. HMSC08G10 TaxID=1581141 RepID=UPI000ABD1C6A